MPKSKFCQNENCNSCESHHICPSAEHTNPEKNQKFRWNQQRLSETIAGDFTVSLQELLLSSELSSESVIPTSPPLTPDEQFKAIDRLRRRDKDARK